MADSLPPSVFQRLMNVIEQRRDGPTTKSYTQTLLTGGVAKIGEKIVEEAAEVVQAAAETNENAKSHLIHEAADLIYHLLVMLGNQKIALDEVEAELARRFGVSGIDEKESRERPAGDE